MRLRVTNLPIHRQLVTWTLPPKGTSKVNFNGTFFQDQLAIRVCVVVRVARGAVMGSLSKRVIDLLDINCVEALETFKAIQFDADLGLQNVIFEGDSLSVVLAILHGNGSLSSFGHLMDAFRAIVGSFHHYGCVYVGRLGNRVARGLIRLVKHGPQFST
ncbi:hypothetical protein LOK49_LG08G00996 [Camellia lanceoleosa]|uniref:Uncharacterized protein n=1 Tax=Camellia lanceoleosa TaxID=1840588 RepID=A0ACC0GW48_9ERIC|nr:hypothetical protein LOK49_LG08G00996 [Camellia lanceoleosa]